MKDISTLRNLEAGTVVVSLEDWRKKESSIDNAKEEVEEMRKALEDGFTVYVKTDAYGCFGDMREYKTTDEFIKGLEENINYLKKEISNMKMAIHEAYVSPHKRRAIRDLYYKY